MPYNICLLVPDAAVLEKYAKENHLSGEPAELIRRKEVQEMIIQAIREFLKGKFRDYEIPRKYLWLAEDFSLDNEMLTQTMKLKRRVVLEKYKDQIMALYKNDSGLHGA
jgi:long-chain acyl-CoA synthetase